MQDESAELCFSFHDAYSVLYFPVQNIVLEIVLRVHYKFLGHLTHCILSVCTTLALVPILMINNKVVKILPMLVCYGKYCTRGWSQGKHST